MKLSIFTTVTDPIRRGDAYHEAIKCYKDLADEVVVVNGGGQITNHLNVKYVNWKWPKEFEWKFIGKQFQRGYDACTGDWVIRADLDFIFHEKDFAAIRQAMEDNPEAGGLSFYKYQFILPDRYSIKSRVILAVNKGKYGSGIRFDGGGDLCQPTLHGNWLNPSVVPDSGIGFYNYEKILKTKEQITDDVGRMERAWKIYHGETQYRSDGTGKDAYNKWVESQEGKFNRARTHIPINAHPKYMIETIENLQPSQWGFNGHGNLEGNLYVTS